MINDTMEQNRYAMNKIRLVRNVICVVDAVLCLFNIAFYFVGGFMFFFFFDLAAVVCTYISGAIMFNKKKLHFLIMGLNLIAAVIYALFQPVEKFLFITSIAQHLFCFVQMICFTKLGEKEVFLKNEEGYPYFTEQSAKIKKYKEYVPYYNIRSGSNQMDDVNPLNNDIHPDHSDITDHQDNSMSFMQDINNISEEYNQIPRRSDNVKDFYMDGISQVDKEKIEIKSVKKENYQMMDVDYNSVVNDLEKNKDESEKKEYNQLFNTQMRSYSPLEETFDFQLMEENKQKMSTLNIWKKILFTADIFMIFLSIFIFVFNLSKLIFGGLMYVLVLFNIVIAISASVVTETCIENIHFCRKMLLIYFTIGIILTCFCFKYSIPFSCYLCTFQMLLLEIMSKKNDYLKQQEGYPYFNKAALNHLRYTNEYSPENKIDFSPKKMDEI